jgi:hypothetical protein
VKWILGPELSKCRADEDEVIHRTLSILLAFF